MFKFVVALFICLGLFIPSECLADLNTKYNSQTRRPDYYGVNIANEGSDEGAVGTIDYVGTSINTVVSGNMATVTIVDDDQPDNDAEVPDDITVSGLGSLDPDALTGDTVDDDKIDVAVLNSSVIVSSEINTFSKLDAIVADKSLVNLADGGTFALDISVPAEVYAVGWNGSNEVPTKNDVYDKIESLSGVGEVNTASNTGSTGVGLFKQKSVADLEFFKINSTSTDITIALDGTDKLDVTFNPGNVASTELSDTADILYEVELDSEGDLEGQLVGVTNVYTNNDGALNDDDVTNDNVESMATTGASGTAPISNGSSVLTMTDVITETELANEANLETQLGGINVLVNTELNTEGKFETILGTEIQTNDDSLGVGFYYLDGGGSAMTTATIAYATVQEDIEVTEWEIISSDSDTFTATVYKGTYTTDTWTEVSGTEDPNVSASKGNSDTSLTTWTDKTWDAGEDIKVEITSAPTTATWAQVTFRGTRR